MADGGYMVFIFPANLLLRKVGPKVQFGVAVAIFGVFVCCYDAARNYGDLIGLRFLVGGAEALLQSIALYMISWYGRNELGKRIGMFYLIVKDLAMSHTNPFSFLLLRHNSRWRFLRPDLLRRAERHGRPGRLAFL